MSLHLEFCYAPRQFLDIYYLGTIPIVREPSFITLNDMTDEVYFQFALQWIKFHSIYWPHKPRQVPRQMTEKEREQQLYNKRQETLLAM